MSAAESTLAASGLEGIPAAETALSHVDGDTGRLILCGYDLETFAAQHDFESAAAAFWRVARDQRTPSSAEVRAALGTARQAAFERFTAIAPALGPLTLSEGLRLGLASIPAQAHDAAADTNDPKTAVAGAIPVLIANIVRTKQGKSLAPPNPDLAHVEDFLRMLHGASADCGDVNALSTYLVTVMDHGMNASTFAARVVASTRADLVSAVVGAYAALTGPLHGGAPGPVLNMLDAIGTSERATDWIDAALRNGERIMGFGHRIYRVRDPRADVLKAALHCLGSSSPRLELARAVEVAVLDALGRHKPDRKLETNVEFYTAMLLDALDIPRKAFTPVFAMGRVIGWTAHALEQQRRGRLIRPTSIYVGTSPAPSYPGGV